MINPLITQKFESKILELIDNRDQYTRSDLQAIITVLINKIMENCKELSETKHKPFIYFSTNTPPFFLLL